MTPRMGAGLLNRVKRRYAAERNERRLLTAIDRIASGSDVSRRPDGPIVAIASLHSGPWHLAVEILLAHALQLRGARCQLLACDVPDLPVCDERTACSASLDRCAGCLSRTRPLLAASRLPWRGLSAFVPANAIADVAQRVNRLSDAELDGHHEGGWPVGQWLHVSACHYLRRDARAADAECAAARRRHLVSAGVLVEAIGRWLDAVGPDHVMVESGAHLAWRIVRELSRARGIAVTAREVGKGGWDRHIYALNADAMDPDLEAEWRSASTVPLDAGQEAEVDAFLDQLPKQTFDNAHVAPRRSTAELRADLRLPAGGKIAVAFTNVTWDLATAGRDRAFDGSLDWLRETVKHVQAGDQWHLIVRGHPAEASVLTRERVIDQLRREPIDPARVTFIEPETPVRMADLGALADVVLAYNSTAGLEAASRGATVLLAGRPHFGGKGFTIDVLERAAYAPLLQAVAAGQLGATAMAPVLARRYAYLFFFRYHMAMSWTTSPLSPPFDLTVNSLDQLAPGRNANLDVVCDGILNGRQILRPAAVPA